MVSRSAWGVAGHEVAQALRVGAEQDGFGEEAVEQQVVEGCRLLVGGVVGGGPGRAVRVGDADLPGAGGAQRADGESVGEELVVGGRQGVEQELLAGGVDAEGVAEQGVLGGFVEGDPVADAVAEPGGDRAHVLGEPGRGVPFQPVQVGGEVPVVEGDDGADAGGAQFVDEPVVEAEAAGEAARGQDTEKRYAFTPRPATRAMSSR
ncbi:hypothetical protein GCM10020256_52630 [Streptomyces thermocoprophilus]